MNKYKSTTQYSYIVGFLKLLGEFTLFITELPTNCLLTAKL